MDVRDLLLDGEGVIDRRASGIVHQLRTGTRRDDLEEAAGPLERLVVVDDNFIHVRGQLIAQRAHEEIALGIQQPGLVALGAPSLHVLVQTHEVREVALELHLRALEPGGSQDETEPLGQIELIEDLTHLAALLLVLDLARHAHLVHLRHHHEEAAGDRQVAGERRTLGAHAFLEDLNEDLIAPAQCRLDRRALAARRLVPHLLGGVVALAGEIARMQIADVQESVVAHAEIDERRLDRGLHVDDFSDVDVADAALRRELLTCELFEPAVFHDRDPAFLAGYVVDQHLGLRLCFAFTNHSELRTGAFQMRRARRCRRGQWSARASYLLQRKPEDRTCDGLRQSHFTRTAADASRPAPGRLDRSRNPARAQLAPTRSAGCRRTGGRSGLVLPAPRCAA